jgi:hypothetical protein
MNTYKEHFSYLLEVQSSRVIQKIDSNKIEMVKNKLFNVARLDPVKFWRSSRYDYNPPFINPQKIKRSSKDTFNLYYIIMDTFPSWKDYPSRSKSVIFTNSYSVADEYTGTIHRVYPANNAKIAWARYVEGFIEFPLLKEKTGMDLTQFLNRFRAVAGNVSNQSIPSGITEADWKVLSEIMDNKLKNHDWSIKYDPLFSTNLRGFEEKLYETMKEGYQKGLGINDILDGLFNPRHNSVGLANLNDTLEFFSEKKPNKEMWTDALCYVERASESDDI